MSKWSHADEDRLVGRVIRSVGLSSDRDEITVTFTDGTTATAHTEGDCCSQTWIEHLTVPPDIDGAEITGYSWAEDVPQDTRSVNVPTDVYLDEIEVYGEAIRTTRGEILIEFRNSSNGYYGGSLEWSVPA